MRIRQARRRQNGTSAPRHGAKQPKHQPDIVVLKLLAPSTNCRPVTQCDRWIEPLITRCGPLVTAGLRPVCPLPSHASTCRDPQG